MSLFRGFAARGGFVALATMLLAACSDKPVPPCPQVRVDRDTAQLIKFASDANHDPTNVAYGVQLVGYDGQCAFKDEGVDVTMNIAMDLVRGPAAGPSSVTIPYFVAIPQYFPAPEGKGLIMIDRDLPAKPGMHQRLEEKNIHVFLPLKKEQPAAAFDIYIGFQLTPAEVDFNRSQRK